MIKGKIKNAKGISLVSLAIAVIVLVILTNIIIYNARDNLKVGNLKEMQNDIMNLRDKVSSYYAQNGKIPASLRYTNIEAIKQANLISDNVDEGEFFVIDLSALDNLTLNYGKDFEKVKGKNSLTEEEEKNFTDLYIINETSHNIFYVEGIKLDNEIFYTDYTSEDVDLEAVDLRYVDNVKIPEGFYYVGGTKDTGIVISDVKGDDLENTKQGNQFVWVLVEPKNFKRIAGYYNKAPQELTTDYKEPYENGYDTEVLEYETMKKSVEANGGFYIGRFETGKDSSGNAIVKKDVDVYNNVPWGKSMTDISVGAVKLSKDFANEKGYRDVTSTLCYSIQWDAAMQFIDSNYGDGNYDENSYVKNSANKGWYSDNYNSTAKGNTRN